jgi:Domain of unknown function (DUF927)
MHLPDFLAAVLPSSGYYCAAELTSPLKQHVYTDDLQTLQDTCDRFNTQSKNSYFGLASFKTKGSREAANSQFMRALFVDLDVGTGTKVYGSKKEAAAALQLFLTETGLATLGAPWLVDSGGGIHCYWPLDEDAPIADWLPVAVALKRRAKELGFRIDMTVTADAARVLRVPGTHNWKYSPPRPVLLRHRGAVFSLAALAKTLGPALATHTSHPAPLAISGVRPTAKGNAPLLGTSLLLAQNSVTMFKNIMVRTVAGTGCGQIAHYIANAKEDGMEPLWRGMLSLTQKCDDGLKSAEKLSALHPYDTERMARKLAEIKGPYACTTFDSENPGICTTCSHWGKITNPLALGRVVQADTAEKIYVLPAEDNESDDVVRAAPYITRPTLPRGFFYGKQGGVYLHKPALDGEGGKDVMLTAFDFFMVDMLQEGTSYVSRFAAVRDKSVVFVVIPNRAMGSKDDVIKQLAAQNIIAAHGSGNDKNLYDFVRACIGEASVNDSALRVPPTLGWQPDGSYAISDKVIQAGGKGYTYVSDRLTNIINATTTKGTVGDWQRVIHMLQDKGQSGIVALGAIGFASPLMKWVDDGTPGMVFHACGRQSGAGKSLALSLCASIWGSPSQYPVKPTTSERTMLQRAGLLGNNPLLIDEITSKSRKSEMEWMPEFVFDFSQGGHKLKGSGSSNSELTNDLFWQALALVTSNAPAMEQMMGARDTSSEGETRRLLEWRVEDKLLWTDAERELLPLLGQNYGVAGRKYADWLVNNVDVAKKVLADTIQGWRTRVKPEDAERYWTSGCGAIIAGCILAGPKYANVCNIKVLPVFKFLESLVLDARRIIDSNQQNAEDVINAYTREFHGQFVKVGNAPNAPVLFADGRTVRPDSARGRIAGRVEEGIMQGWVDYYIEVSMLKRYCALRNWSYMELERQLGKTATVSTVRKDLLAKTGGPALRVLCLRISRPISADDTFTA